MERLENMECDISEARTMRDVAECVYYALGKVDVYRLDGVSEKGSSRLVSEVEAKASEEGLTAPFHYHSSKDGKVFFSYDEIANS